MKKFTRILACFLCLCMLAGSTTIVEAKSASSLKINAYKSVFDVDYYYNTYPDVQAAYGYDYNKLFNHFMSSGAREGRSGSADFNLSIYMGSNPDLLAAYGADYDSYCIHYYQIGYTEGRITHDDGVTPISRVLGTCTTTYNSREARATNIAVASSRINGVIVEPGQGFSFSQTVLPRTSANGYVEAPIFVNKKHGVGIGGGICQVSSTLYSAMLNAGVPATERHPHSLAVPYLPAGRDATIAGNYLDLKFTNVLQNPIQIISYTNKGSVSVVLLEI